MRRCQDTVFELESFLEREHGFVVPSLWRWDPHTPSVHDKNMKKVILASLSENVAMFFGRNQLGYEVAQTGQHVQLASLSVTFSQCLMNICNLLGHVSRIRKACLDERIFVEVKVDENLIQLYVASHDMNTTTMLVSDVLEYKKKRLHTECMEKCLYHGSGSASPMALFGSGAEIKHLELEKHSLSVDVYHSNINAIDDKELLMFFEKNTSGSICVVYKFQGMGKDPPDREKWGKITFLSPDAAKRAVELDGDEFCGSNLKILPSQSAMGRDKTFLFPEVKARIFWPRKLSRGFGIVIYVNTRNNRVLAVIHAVKPLPPFNALATYDLKSGNRLFLSPLPTDEEAIANDVAIDYNDNAYITNSIGNYIWKVNVKGEASIFSKSSRFTEHPVDRDTPYSYIGLNGIAYVSSEDYLLVVQSNTGKVFKVDADDGTARHVLLNEDLTRPDGVVFRSDGVILVVSPQANKLWLLKSNNGWGEGVVYDKFDLESEGYPTSVVLRGRDKMYVLYGYFLEGLLGNSEREGFRIEEIMSPKQSEGENVWLYVMIGFGMVYFLYWRFQMGQLVKHMNKKIN
ncbi:hypothetical protein KIW84_050816 [Lathyrus oleraceus]|uniref:DEAH11/12 RNA-binding domain-containing protein n=1 Tax=Pisum sativum TaxID=3888 RepID=A0A9D5AF46_PEA|nr:hypothetical protein KIW84_050816 [Pisum sativum]